MISRKNPLLRKEGWTRPQANVAKPRCWERTGWSGTSYTALAALACIVWIIAGSVSPVHGLQKAAAPPSSDTYQNVYNGWKWWHVYCYRCHGMNAIGGNLAPNLIDPNAKLPLKDFLYRVRNGSADGQMQPWDKLLDDKQITQLYYYVMARTDKVLPPGRPDEVGPKGGPWVPPKGWPKFQTGAR